MEDMSVTLEVLKVERSRDSREEQSRNIQYMLVTPEVSRLAQLICANSSQPKKHPAKEPLAADPSANETFFIDSLSSYHGALLYFSEPLHPIPVPDILSSPVSVSSVHSHNPSSSEIVSAYAVSMPKTQHRAFPTASRALSTQLWGSEASSGAEEATGKVEAEATAPSPPLGSSGVVVPAAWLPRASNVTSSVETPSSGWPSSLTSSTRKVKS